MIALEPRDALGEWIHNTTQPLRDFRRCHCHNWRIDECPNVLVAIYVRTVSADLDATR